MARLSALPATLLTLALAACGMAGAATLHSQTPPAQRQAESLTCRLTVVETPVGTAIAGRIQSATAVQGSYALRVLQRSSAGTAQLSQGGDFSARAGQTLTLGEASFPGRARDLTAALSVEIGGKDIPCPAG